MDCPLDSDFLDEIQESFGEQHKGYPKVFIGDITKSERPDFSNGSHYFINIQGVSAIIGL